MDLFNFTKNEEKENNRGLAITLDELIDMQKQLVYLSPVKNKMSSTRAGDVKSAFKGRGMEFEEVREYNMSDNARDIDWRVTARRQEPYTKVFTEEKDREIVVVLDLSATMVFGTKHELKSVTAAKFAALIGWMAIKNKDRFSLLIYDGQDSYFYKAQNNVNGLMLIFNKIIGITQKILQKSYFGNICDALKVLEYHQKNRQTVFIISDFYDFNAEKIKKIAALARKNQLYCINVFDVLEELAPVDGLYAAQLNDEKVVFNSSVENFKQTYQQYFKHHRNIVKENCQKFLCHYIEIRTDMPIFKQLII